jgi:malate dehydrogenase (oxaloacetate-decarboxylating)
MGRISARFRVEKNTTGQSELQVHLRGAELLRSPLVNRGTAFTLEQRVELGLEGLLPPHVSTLAQQLDRQYRAYVQLTSDLSKYQFLRALQDRNEVLFSALVSAHLEEMLPIVYTPTVGEAVQKFHVLYQNARGLSISDEASKMDRYMDNCPVDDVRMVVATDSSAILGLGDQGYGGLAIPIGKLALYTVGGVAPWHALPVALDVGSDRAALMSDPLYLGVRHGRLKGEPYLAFMDRFVGALKKRWPRAVLQWEDLAKDTAFTVLERYRDALPSFNDDIQGTGAVALAGVLVAARLRSEKVSDQKIIVHGAGAGGIGVARALHNGMIKEGLSAEQAYQRIFVLDSKGLLTSDREIEAYKRDFVHPLERTLGWTSRDLLGVVRAVKPTSLLGLSGQPGAFDDAVLAELARGCERPIVFPLSNPTSSSEATPEQIARATGGKAVIATGSPFPKLILDDGHGPREVEVGQGNNAFIFPGVGFGAILAEASKITDGMVSAAAYALADYTTEKHAAAGRIYPPTSELREVSLRVATAVMLQAFADGVARTDRTDPAGAAEYVQSRAFKAEYLPIA